MGKYETTLSGAAITSTLNQMSMIGDIGKEILKKFGIKKINLSKEYSFKIRGAIHSETRKRFGKDALYFYGLTMMDGYEKIVQAQLFKADDIYKTEIVMPFKVIVGNADFVKGTYNNTNIDFMTNANRLTRVNTVNFSNDKLD